MNTVADEIKNVLSMDDVARFYGCVPNHAGYISCPFHDERTPSLKIYTDTGRGWHCFGCGAGGSVIDFVMQLLDISFPAALVRLNTDFRLGLSFGKLDPRETARLREDRAAKKRALAAYEADYMARTYEYRRLWLAKKIAPAAPDEPINVEYAEACRKLDALDEWFAENPYRRGGE